MLSRGRVLQYRSSQVVVEEKVLKWGALRCWEDEMLRAEVMQSQTTFIDNIDLVAQKKPDFKFKHRVGESPYFFPAFKRLSIFSCFILQ